MVAALVATSKSERPHKYNPLGGNWRSATNGNTESRKLAVVPPGGPGGTNSGPSLHTIHWIAFNNLLRLVSGDLNVLRSAHLKVQSNLGVFEIARLVGFQEYFVTSNRRPYPTIHAPKEEVALKFCAPLIVWLNLVSEFKIGTGVTTGYE